MSETETFERLLGGLETDVSQVQLWLDAQPRRANTFLTCERTWGEEQWMPLHVAAASGATPVVRLLLERGVKPDCRTRFVTPLHARQTPLHLAAVSGHGAVVEALLEAAAEPEVRDAQQQSPLWLAARHGHGLIVQALARRGAMMDPLDSQGRTPLHAALLPVVAEPQGQGDRPWSPEAALSLIGLGANFDAQCPKEPEGFTPLHRCVSLGPVALGVAERLVEAGVDRTLADPRFGRTARELAEHLEQEDFVGLLS